MPSTNREDYLRAIFTIGEQGDGTVKSIDIVKYLDVSKPAVSEMLKKLKKDNYIEKTPYSRITLTYKGFELAKKITYKHRVAERFLKDVLKVKKEKLHEEAHKLEHSMSDEVAQKLGDFLDNPKLCPCGHQIPKL